MAFNTNLEPPYFYLLLWVSDAIFAQYDFYSTTSTIGAALFDMYLSQLSPKFS